MKKCAYDGCGRESKARGWCPTHYMQWRRTGVVKQTRWRRERPVCREPNCERDAVLVGKCSKHAKADIRQAAPGSIPGSAERFWAFVDKTGGCWAWTGQTSVDGYGHFDGWLCHRYSWVLAGRTIPDGLFLDHKCRNRMCVNLDHLHVVTRKQNQENLGVRVDNSTGYRGVTYRQATGKFAGNVGHFGKRHFVGYFKTAEEAAEATRRKRLELYTNNQADLKIV